MSWPRVSSFPLCLSAMISPIKSIKVLETSPSVARACDGVRRPCTSVTYSPIFCAFHHYQKGNLKQGVIKASALIRPLRSGLVFSTTPFGRPAVPGPISYYPIIFRRARPSWSNHRTNVLFVRLNTGSRPNLYSIAGRKVLLLFHLRVPVRDSLCRYRIFSLKRDTAG